MSGSKGYIRTIEDMERLYYGAGTGQNAWAYAGTDLLKADSPMMSSTTGTYQAIFGRKVWSQLNQEFNAFSILPKKPWEKSGWRVTTAKPDFTKGGGVGENATLPETTKPTFEHVSTKPKTVAHSFDLSETAMFLADKDDGLGDARAVMKMEMAKHHTEHINQMLLSDVQTVAGNDFESLDRITSSAFVETAASFVDVITDHNIYNLTRTTGSSQSWYDAQVDAYNGVLIIPSKDVQKDGSSRMYFLDTDYSWFTTAKPTLYHESGIETGDPFGINRLGQMGMFHTMGELVSTFFKASGKIRDLS